MVNKCFVVLLFCLGIFLYPNSILAAPNQPIIIDHQDVSTFSTLSDADISRAAALKMLIRHASIGGNIKTGLSQLYTQNNKYNWSNWVFQSRGNPGWQPKIDDLVTQVSSQELNYNIFTMKFCYVDPNTNWDYYRDHMETLQSTYPSKIFIWWTIPLTTTGTLDQVKRNQFNNTLRAYAQTHNIILFDIAAVESHDPNGNLYQATFQSNRTDSMYPAYSSDGGHLNATGYERVAKAFWVMVATIASSDSVNLTKAGDANGDNKVDGVDYVVWLNHYNQNITGATSGDFNNSGKVDGVDYVIWLNNYNSF